jgi:NAD(P)-dependent dehydrogenase (short-subunit alcohol dehydrogenase family)
MSLAKKTAIVTGAAGGLGKAIATAFLKAGASVTICDINKDRLSSAQSELSALGPVHVVGTDIRSEESVKELVAETVAKFGGLDIVVNNAGMMDRFDPVGTLEKDLWDRVIGVNLTGVYLVSKYGVNAMLEKEGEGQKGVVLNISSLGGINGGKAGSFNPHPVLTFFHALSLFVGRG